MKINMGFADRVIRILVAIALIVLSFTAVKSGVISIVLLVVGIVFLVTSFFGVCPLYSLIGVNTCPKSAKAGDHS